MRIRISPIKYGYGFVCGEYRFLMPHSVDERTLSIGSVLDALNAVLSMCLLYVSLGSRVIDLVFSGF